MADIKITGEGRDPKGRRISIACAPIVAHHFPPAATRAQAARLSGAPRAVAQPRELKRPHLRTGPSSPHKRPSPRPSPAGGMVQSRNCKPSSNTRYVLMAQAGDLARLIESEGGVQPAGTDCKSAAQPLSRKRDHLGSTPQREASLGTELYAIEGRKERSLTPIQT